MDRCNVCCTGGGADALGSTARKDAMDTLQSVVFLSNEDENDGSHLLEEQKMITDKEQKLQQVIEEVGRVALKYHPETQSKEGTSDEATPGDRAKKRLVIDIWVVRASQTKQIANSP